jgi:hypothetical protein
VEVVVDPGKFLLPVASQVVLVVDKDGILEILNQLEQELVDKDILVELVLEQLHFMPQVVAVVLVVLDKMVLEVLKDMVVLVSNSQQHSTILIQE